MDALQGRKILLCVGGGIAAYKACEVARLCGKANAQVRVALTPAAQRFVSPLTFQALTGSPASTDLFDAQQELAAGHIALADWAELARTSGEKAGTDAKVMRHLREVENETRRTVAQLQSFMSYSSGERGARIARDVNELVRDALSMVRPMARIKELRLEESSGEPPRVVCDPFAIRQLLLNLLLNALDFARTRIQITTRAVDSQAEVVVADDGPGVPPGDRERIFQRFVTTRPGGNGLGLSTSREIAEAHGGTLSLVNTDSGATFAVRLPAAS